MSAPIEAFFVNSVNNFLRIAAVGELEADLVGESQLGDKQMDTAWKVFELLNVSHWPRFRSKDLTLKSSSISFAVR